MLKRLVLLTVLPFVLAACQFGNVSVQRNEGGGAAVTITLSESEVNTLVQTALTGTGNPLLRNPTIDLQPGQIVINGTHDRRDGSGTVSGSVTVTLSVSGGKVQAQITAANIEGVALTDERIASLNQQLAIVFGNRINRDNRNAQVTAITITDSSIQITISVG